MARPLATPDGFAANANLTNDELAAIYGHRRHETFAKWRASVGVVIKAKRRRFPLPADWLEFAPGKHTDTLKAHYRVSQRVISRWRKETGVKGDKPMRKTRAGKRSGVPAPEGFADLAPTMLVIELCRHYVRSAKTIHRWLGETGAKPKPYREPSTRPVPPRRRRLAGSFVLAGPMVAQLSGRKAGREEDAAHYLRRFSAVYRCGERGAADARGKLWRCGNSILTPVELEARARRHGWDPDEWRIIAGAPVRRVALPSFPQSEASR